MSCRLKSPGRAATNSGTPRPCDPRCYGRPGCSRRQPGAPFSPPRSDAPPKMHDTVPDDHIRCGRLRPILHAQFGEQPLPDRSIAVFVGGRLSASGQHLQQVRAADDANDLAIMHGWDPFDPPVSISSAISPRLANSSTLTTSRVIRPPDISRSHQALPLLPGEATLACDRGVDVDQRDISLRDQNKNTNFGCRIVSRWFIGIGLALVLIGLLWPWLGRLGLGRLPGDIVVDRGNFSFYFPIVTCFVVSGSYR